MKDKKIYIILISIYVVIALIAVIFIGVNNKQKGYIILPGYDLYYKNKNTIKSYNKKIDELKDIITITDIETKKLKFKNEEQLEIYENNEITDIRQNLIMAYSSNLNFDIANYSKETLNDEDIKILNQILEEHDIIGYENLNTNEKISFDYDQNGIEETIYFVSNLFEETVYDKVFAFVYYIENNEIKYLSEQVTDILKIYDLCVPRMNSIVDLDEDKKYEFIISCEYFSNKGIQNSIYKKQNNLFELINK